MGNESWKALYFATLALTTSQYVLLTANIGCPFYAYFFAEIFFILIKKFFSDLSVLLKPALNNYYAY